MNDPNYRFNCMYKGENIVCTYSITTSEVSCIVTYFVNVQGEKSGYVEFTSEGDSNLFENQASNNLEEGLKEGIRRALDVRVNKP